MTMLTDTTRTNTPPAGPFHPEASDHRGTLGQALITSMLALYPVLATVGVVLISMAYSAAT